MKCQHFHKLALLYVILLLLCLVNIVNCICRLLVKYLEAYFGLLMDLSESLTSKHLKSDLVRGLLWSIVAYDLYCGSCQCYLYC